MTSISFFVAGEPKAQPRARAFAMRFGHKWQARVYNPGTAEEWKSRIAIAAEAHVPARPLIGPLRLDAAFFFPRLASHYRAGKLAWQLKDNAPRYHTSKPDRDNLDKAILDCLKVLGFFHDDAQVCAGEITKEYTHRDVATCGCKISLMQLLPERSDSNQQI